MKRRSFIVGSFGLLVARGNFNAAPSKIKSSPLGRIVSPYRHKLGNIILNGLMMLDLDRRKMKTVELPFSIHKVTLGHEKSKIGYGVGSYSNHIAKIDLKREFVLSVNELDPRFTYSGHSIVTKTGEIYASISLGQRPELRTGLARINPITFKIEEEFLFPKMEGLGSVHDVQVFSPNGNILVCTGGSILIQFDLMSKSILRIDKVDLDIEGSSLNHFAFNSKGDFGIQSNVFEVAPKNSAKSRAGAPVLFDGKTKKFKILRQKGELAKRLDQELFGICICNDSSILAVAHPWDEYISFWNTNTGTFIKGYDFPRPTGVTLSPDGKYFLVTTTIGLKSFDSVSLELVTSVPDFKEEFTKLFGLTFNEGRLFHSTGYI